MIRILSLSCIALLTLSACTQLQLGAHVGKQIASQSSGTFKVGNPYKIRGKWYTPRESYDHVETGIASWYGPNFHGKQTANGEIFDKRELTAAHRTLQMPSLVRVTNLENGKSLVLRINDRGPFAKGRIIDVSERASELLGFKNQGTAKVRVEVLPEPSRQIAAAAKGGKDTGGTELAFNRGRSTPQPAQVRQASLGPDPFAPPSLTQQEAQRLNVSERGLAATSEVPGHVEGGRFLPDPVVVDRYASSAADQIFVQAGSFSNQANAVNLSSYLGQIAPAQVQPVTVNGQAFHRVRLGPFNDMAQARVALNRVTASGQGNAVIIVE